MAPIPLREPKQHALGNDVEDHQGRTGNRRMSGGERSHRFQDIDSLSVTIQERGYTRRAFRKIAVPSWNPIVVRTLRISTQVEETGTRSPRKVLENTDISPTVGNDPQTQKNTVHNDLE